MSELEQRIADLPVWQGKLRIEPLLGGLSNLSFTVTDAAGKYVVRFGRDYPFHHVDRHREVMTARAAHAAGFCQEVVYDEPGLMVSRFIEGRVFTDADIRANPERIAAFIRDFHEQMPLRITGTAFMFWVFHVIRDYANTLKASPNPLIARIPAALAINAELEAAQMPLPIRFGHNDLLPANLIDDGKRLWLIDYEYAGFNTAMFDLAGLASNAGFDASQSDALLTAYFGAPPSTEIRRSHAAMQCVSLLREALWGLVSELHLNAPGADYNAYAIDNFARFDAAYAAYQSQYGTSK
ncbi:phosphotransferase [Devosia sp.]|uniref:phosphotransferase n=1 Tax=Devosia sp. TaxID=1871048 RepID=UPI003266B0A9